MKAQRLHADFIRKREIQQAHVEKTKGKIVKRKID